MKFQTSEHITQEILDSIRSLIAQLPAEIALPEQIKIKQVLEARNVNALPNGATDHQLTLIETRLQKCVWEHKANG
jgi:hypothetical protein